MEIIKKLVDTHVLTGIVLGVLVGSLYPSYVEALKPILLFIGFVLAVGVLSVKTK